MRITVVRGDLVTQDVDVVVNAANPWLAPGGGVCGAIARAGGPRVFDEAERIRRERFPDGVPTGQAVLTTAGDLPARMVVHAVGPVYDATEDRSALLRSAYAESLALAADAGARTVAFPAISAGIYGWPLGDAARQAVAAVRTAAAEPHLAETIAEVRFVLLGRESYEAFAAALGDGTA